jgi:dolichyl-phosphate beta-glucosyltransferase
MHVIHRALRSDSKATGRLAAFSPVLMPSDHDLTVIIPAYNEERRLPRTLKALSEFLSCWGIDYRILVADDGSADRTSVLGRDWGPRCSTLRLNPQGGKGRAVRTAMLHATGRVLAFTDADLPFALSAIRMGYETIHRGDCQLVFGARDMEGAANVAPRQMTRRLATFAFSQVVRHMISRQVTDTQCGLKIFSRQAAIEIFSRTTIDGFAFDAEVVMLTHRLGLPFQRIPVTLVNEFDSSLSLWRDSLPMLLDVFRMWFRDRFGWRRPMPRVVFAETHAGSEDDRKRLAA